jgi:hypothetical protein
MRFIIHAFFLCLLASCGGGASSKPADSNSGHGVLSTDLNQVLDDVPCPSDDFRGVGIGYNESDALTQARSNMALEHFSQKLKANVQISGQNIDRVASTSTKTNIDQEVALANAQDAKLHFSARRGNKTGVVACMSHSDAAKSFVERLRPIADSIEFAAKGVIDARHPRLKSEAWQKTNALWGEFISLHTVIQSLDKEQAALFEPANLLYAKARDRYIDFCQTAKLYWNPEQNDIYSEIAFSKLSKNLKLEKASCEGNGISLAYKNTGHKCEYAGMYECHHKPSLLIASCYGEEYQLLESENVKTYQRVEEVALEKLREKLRYEAFWNEWEQEIKQWRPICQ